jgi:hypothetical protein
MTVWTLEGRGRERLAGFCSVSVSIHHLLASLPFFLISCRHASMSRRLWVLLQSDCYFGSGLGSDHVAEIPLHELRPCRLFGIVKGVSLYVQYEGNKIHPLKICAGVTLDNEKNPGDDGLENLSASVNVLSQEEH